MRLCWEQWNPQSMKIEVEIRAVPRITNPMGSAEKEGETGRAAPHDEGEASHTL